MNHPVQSGTTATAADDQSALYRAVSGLEPGDAVLMVMWHSDAPVSEAIDDVAVTVLDESLATLVQAELPEGAVLGSWGRGRVLAILPSASPAAAARAGRRARRAWRAHWLAPVFCSAVALAAGPDVLTRAEPALRAAATRRTGSVVCVDAIHDDATAEDATHDDPAHGTRCRAGARAAA